MVKTIHQEVAEFLDARAKKLAADAEQVIVKGDEVWNEVRKMIAHEFNLLSEHLFSQVEKRGLATPVEEDKKPDA